MEASKDRKFKHTMIYGSPIKSKLNVLLQFKNTPTEKLFEITPNPVLRSHIAKRIPTSSLRR